ncbi:hypothetical protein B484DRAFT_448202 [Ochromonadaceae sp. CCMP2298]|nr:hypothetical protein B484DRAFT_448202 [Ochromonadaceae sp. CCMP2298]
MSKNRREEFENQLRDLQKDISNLSSKLNIPAAEAPPQSYANGESNLSASYTSSQEINRSIGSRTNRGDALAQQMQDCHVARKERDDAVYKLETVQSELQDLRRSLQEGARVKASYEHLRQDCESLKISLESSERIRRQQKELIALLQRSHSIASNGVSNAGTGGDRTGGGGGDGGSVMSFNSFNSLSSISHKPEDTSALNLNVYAEVLPRDRERCQGSQGQGQSLQRSEGLPASQASQDLHTSHGLQGSQGVRGQRKGRRAEVTPSVNAENQEWLDRSKARPASSKGRTHPPISASHSSYSSSAAHSSLNSSATTGVGTQHRSPQHRRYRHSINANTTVNADSDDVDICASSELLLGGGDESYQSILRANRSLLPSANAPALVSGAGAGAGDAYLAYRYEVFPVRSPLDVTLSQQSLQSLQSLSLQQEQAQQQPRAELQALAGQPARKGGGGTVTSNRKSRSGRSSNTAGAFAIRSASGAAGKPPRYPGMVCTGAGVGAGAGRVTRYQSQSQGQGGSGGSQSSFSDACLPRSISQSHQPQPQSQSQHSYLPNQPYQPQLHQLQSQSQPYEIPKQYPFGSDVSSYPYLTPSEYPPADPYSTSFDTRPHTYPTPTASTQATGGNVTFVRRIRTGASIVTGVDAGACAASAKVKRGKTRTAGAGAGSGVKSRPVSAPTRYAHVTSSGYGASPPPSPSPRVRPSPSHSTFSRAQRM